MKKTIPQYILILLTTMTLLSCKEALKDHDEYTKEETKISYQPISNKVLENGVIYEVNIRQYSESGTFNDFTKDIPELKKLGVKVISLTPIFPISEKNRRARGNVMVEDIKSPVERAKYLGSHYAVANYEKVNPDYGTKEELDQLIQIAHNNGMYVILDWVSDRTGWDNPWIEEYPNFYHQDGKGNIVHPKGTDWKDTASLNYENEELWSIMISSMTYWVENHGIDGFHYGVTNEIPGQFWDIASQAIKEVKPVLMFSGGENRDISTFDVISNKQGEYIMNQLVEREVDVNVWDEYMLQRENKNAVLMNFNYAKNLTNNSDIKHIERANEAMLAFKYMIPGIPLIYSGQEYGMTEPLNLLEKNEIPYEKGKMWDMMEKLGRLKTTNPALHGGKDAAVYRRINTSENLKVYAVEREKDGHKVIYIVNFSEELIEFTAPMVSGKFKDLIRGSESNIPEDYNFTFPPYGYRVWEAIE